MNAPPIRRAARSWRLISLAIVGAGLALLLGANWHLVHVALASQPDCVPHIKENGGTSAYRAARSAC